MQLTQRALAIVTASLFAPVLVHAQEAPAAQEVVRTDGVPIFFSNYVNKGIKPKHLPTETDAEYIARLPKPWDTKRIVYLEMEIRHLGKAFDYDPATQKLTLYVGDAIGIGAFRAAMGKSFTPSQSTTFPVLINTTVTKTGEYVSKSASGAKKKVEKVTIANYAVLITNIAKIPSTLYKTEVIEVILLPSFGCRADEARKLTRNPLDEPMRVGVPLISPVPPLEVIGAFKMHSYKGSGTGADHDGPTPDSRHDYAETVFWIEADLVGLTVRNRATKKVYADYTFDTDIFANDVTTQQ